MSGTLLTRGEKGRPPRQRMPVEERKQQQQEARMMERRSASALTTTMAHRLDRHGLLQLLALPFFSLVLESRQQRRRRRRRPTPATGSSGLNERGKGVMSRESAEGMLALLSLCLARSPRREKGKNERVEREADHIPIQKKEEKATSRSSLLSLFFSSTSLLLSVTNTQRAPTQPRLSNWGSCVFADKHTTRARESEKKRKKTLRSCSPRRHPGWPCRAPARRAPTSARRM